MFNNGHGKSDNETDGPLSYFVMYKWFDYVLFINVVS